MMRQSDKISLEDIQEVVGHSKGSRITDEHYNLDCLGDKHKQEKAKNKADKELLIKVMSLFFRITIN